MIDFYSQQFLSDHKNGVYGDCMAACIKTILQDSLEGYPHPISSDGGAWNLDFFERLTDECGYYLNIINLDTVIPQNRFIIAGGPTIRSKDSGATHAVVWDYEKNMMFWDPHPSRSGLLSINRYYQLFRGD